MKAINKDSILTILTRVLVMISGVLSSIITAKALGPEGRGELVTVTTIGLTIANFSYLGFPSSNTYFVANNPDRLRPIFFNSICLALCGGLVAMIVSLFYFYGTSLFEFKNIFFLLCYVTTIMISSFSANLLVTIGRVRTYNYQDLFQNLIVVLLYMICYFFRTNVYIYLLAAFGGTLLGAILGVRGLKENLKQMEWKFDFQLFMQGFRYAIKVYITTFIGFLIVRGNILLLKDIKGAEEVGYFSVGLQFYDALAIIPTAIGLLLFPDLLKTDNNNKWKKMNSVLFQVGGLMLTICIAAYFILPFFIEFVFGQSFIPSIEIAQSLLPAAFFVALMSVVSQYLAAIGYPKSQVWIWIFSFCIWVIMSFFFVPKYGSFGTTITLSATNVILFLSLYFLAYKRNTINQ